ncbi:MAG TPA: hypothetical protein VKV69_11645 [Actinomycetota bacterium]|nr:hypothetical protein [Actinomycetota bacterium]
MGEQIWEQRGIAGPLDRIFGGVRVRFPRHSLILATASIVLVMLPRPASTPSSAVLGSAPIVNLAPSITVGPALTLRIPRGLHVEACGRCFIGPYLFRSYIPYPTIARSCEQPWLVGFASTASTPWVVLAHLDDALAGHGLASTTSLRMIGGSPFTVLDYGAGRCLHTIAIGGVAGVTYLVDMRVSTADPMIESILRSISFPI